MDRYALFVDAAYLYAAGGELCYGTTNRTELLMDFQKAVDELRRVSTAKVNLPSLRSYWYDAATDANPTPSHLAVASLEGVQLRLGRLTASGQKGVDSRIVRDLIVLSRNRAITDAYLLSGDDDLREGVSEAQEVGVRVTLIGVEPLLGFRNQAPTLVRAADATIILMKAQIEQFLGRRSIVALVAPDTAGAEQVGRAFAEAFRQRVDLAFRKEVLARRPIVHYDVHKELVTYAEKQLGSFKRHPTLYEPVCKGFWGVLEQDQ